MKNNNFLEWFDTEEGKKSLRAFRDKTLNEMKIKERHLQRFHEKNIFGEFVEKVLTKYATNKYKDRWYSRGIEPPETLTWFLFNYAEKYGRKCTIKEWKQYGNQFSSALFFYGDYYFNRMDGQGSFIKIIKKK